MGVLSETPTVTTAEYGHGSQLDSICVQCLTEPFVAHAIWKCLATRGHGVAISKTILGIFRAEVYPDQYVRVVTYQRPRMTGADISGA
jgi:hypothetical protein